MGQTFVTPEQFPVNEQGQKTDVVSLGDGDFAVSDTDANGNPALLVIDPSNPSNIIVGAAQVPSGVHGITVSGDMLYASTSDGLSVYQIEPLVSDPVTVTVNLPAGTAANIVSGSFNATPTQIVTSATGDQLIWDRSFASGNTTYNFTWQTKVSGVTAGEVVPIVNGAAVTYQDLGVPGSIDLAGSSITGASIISITPQTATAQPGGTATYDIRLTNPTDAQVTYNLSVLDSNDDIEPSNINSATVPAGGVVDVPLTITTFSFATAGNDTITVTADDPVFNASFSTEIADYNGTATAGLTIAGQPVSTPDLTAHGVVLSLSPAQGSIGQNTSASYVVQVTNTGSADDEYDLSVSGLPSDVDTFFSPVGFDLAVPAGASNFRDAVLTLSSPFGFVTPGAYPFTVTAQSFGSSSVTGSVTGTLTVTSLGVSVFLDKQSGAPGDTFTMTVRNTGSVTDTYDLSLGGPAALTASLAQNKVTLAPDASQDVTITTSAINFVLPGTLDLTAIATSEANSAVNGGSSATLNIAKTSGLSATLAPSVQVLPIPGTSSFLLTVNNTGNAEDSYTATIMGTSGPVTATLVGLDGLPTQTIPTFYLPGLSTGAILLQTDLSTVGPGTVTVQVSSLTQQSESASVTAIVSATATPTPTPTPAPTPTPTPTPTSTPAPTPTPTPTPTPPSGDGPTVTQVQRFGFHEQPTSIVLTFDESLAPALADNPAEYQIITLGGPGRGGSHVRHVTPVVLAVYDPATDTVILDPAQRLDVHNRYELIVAGTGPSGLTDSSGRLLDGRGTGVPGSDFMTVISFKTLAGPASAMGSATGATPVSTVLNQWTTGPRVVQGFTAIQVNTVAASGGPIAGVDHVRPHRHRLQHASTSWHCGTSTPGCLNRDWPRGSAFATCTASTSLSASPRRVDQDELIGADQRWAEAGREADLGSGLGRDKGCQALGHEGAIAGVAQLDGLPRCQFLDQRTRRRQAEGCGARSPVGRVMGAVMRGEPDRPRSCLGIGTIDEVSQRQGVAIESQRLIAGLF